MSQLTTVRLDWQPVPETLPPDAEGNWFSPQVWLALSDGRVVQGKCLHRCRNATYAEAVHDWFIGEDNASVDDDVSVVAWMPFAVPGHPGTMKRLGPRESIPVLAKVRS